MPHMPVMGGYLGRDSQTCCRAPNRSPGPRSIASEACLVAWSNELGVSRRLGLGLFSQLTGKGYQHRQTDQSDDDDVGQRLR